MGKVDLKKQAKYKFVFNVLIYGVGPAMIISGLMTTLGFRVRGEDNFIWIGALIIGIGYSLKKLIEDYSK